MNKWKYEFRCLKNACHVFRHYLRLNWSQDLNSLIGLGEI